MKTYEVYLTREIVEKAEVLIEADSPTEAANAAKVKADLKDLWVTYGISNVWTDDVIEASQ